MHVFKSYQGIGWSRLGIWAWMPLFNWGEPFYFLGQGGAHYTRTLHVNIDSLLPRTGTAVIQSMGSRLEIGNAAISDSANVNFPAMAKFS